MIIIQTMLHQFRIISLTWWIAIGMATILMFAFRHRKEQLPGDLLVIYFLIILVSTVLSRDSIGVDVLSDRMNFDLIDTWKARLVTDEYSRSELFLNFCMLMPVGVLFPWATKRGFWQTVLVGFVLILLIELLQLFTGRGWFELSDIVDNTIGVMIGYVLHRAGSAVWRRKNADRRTV